MGNLLNECVKLAVCTAVAVVSISVCQEIILAAREAYVRARKSKCRQDDRETQGKRESKCECLQDGAVMNLHDVTKDCLPFCPKSNCKHNIKDHCILPSIKVKCLDCIPKGERHDG